MLEPMRLTLLGSAVLALLKCKGLALLKSTRLSLLAVWWLHPITLQDLIVQGGSSGERDGSNRIPKLPMVVWQFSLVV